MARAFPGEDTNTSVSAPAASETDRLARHFLARLTRLRIQSATAQSGRGQELIRKAIFSTYLDCRALGVADAAELILALPTGPPTALAATARRTDEPTRKENAS